MQYSPKLKNAAAEINEILKKYDIAAMVVLHTPGFSEYLFNVTPSYTCCKMDQNGMRIKTNPDDPKEKKEKEVNDTFNMLYHFSDVGGMLVGNSNAALNLLKEKFDWWAEDGNHTTNIDQNN